MDLRSLRLYLAVLEHGSITKASESAHVAQPALGLHIRKLEEELGLELLERHSRGVRVTEAGALLAKHAEVILRYADLAKEELTNYAKVPSGHVSIGLTPTAREAISVALVERVSRDLPAVQLTVKEALSESLVEYLLDHRVDAALVYNTREGGDQLVFEPLASESMYFVYPLEDGRRTQPTIPLAEVMRHRLILPTRPHLVRTEVDRLAGNIGVTPNIVHEVDSMPAIRDFVSRGLGCSVMPHGAAVNSAFSETIGSQLVVEPEIKRILHLAYSRRRSISKAFQAVINTLKTLVAEERNRAGGQWQRLESQVRLVRKSAAAG
ncbi:MAG TPA: LysR family transcriptional regulator [Dongiaceae bacterium]|jgi:LysR family nitrogen assimilation transcriptional regulator|nr:LysR family transcriptional regulator [Dongiaceae bacterium]